MSGICVFFLFCSAIVSQPDIPHYDGAVIRFDKAPNVLLAHNFQDGQYFDDIQTGNMLRYRDAEGWHDYLVTEILAFQAIPPDSEKPLLYDGKRYYSPEWVYKNVYNLPHTLVLQTCIYKDGDLNWGRLFVIAEKQWLDY